MADRVDPASTRGTAETGSLVGPSLQVRLLFPAGLRASVVVAGTLGYLWLWRDRGGTVMDALFMTVTTITTSVTKLIRAGRRQPGHQPVRHRRAPAGPPVPQPVGGRLLRDRPAPG
jgi:hypothetical protein